MGARDGAPIALISLVERERQFFNRVHPRQRRIPLPSTPHRTVRAVLPHTALQVSFSRKASQSLGFVEEIEMRIVEIRKAIGPVQSTFRLPER